jgi:hypothetical protein
MKNKGIPIADAYPLSGCPMAKIKGMATVKTIIDI